MSSRRHSQQTFTMGDQDEMVSSFNANKPVLRNTQECPSSSSARIMSSYRGHKGGVTCVKFRPLMKHLVSGGADGSVLMWSLFCRPSLSRHHTQIRPYRFLGHQGEICAVAISPLDTVVASAARDKTVRLWVPTAEGKSSVIRAHSSTVRTVAFSPDGECLLTGGDDKALKIWDVESERFLAGLSGHLNWVRSAEFSSTGRLVVSGGDDKTIRLWDVERHECVHIFCDIQGMVNCTRFHPHGLCIGSSGVDQAVQIWDIRSKMLIQHYAGNAGTVRSLCFHPSGNFLLSTCDDATLKIWDLREGKILSTVKGHEGATTCAEFSPAGDHFASGSQDEQVMLWQSNLKQVRKTVNLGSSLRDVSCFAPSTEQIVRAKEKPFSESTKVAFSNRDSVLPDTDPMQCEEPLESTKDGVDIDKAQEQLVEDMKDNSKEEVVEVNGAGATSEAQTSLLAEPVDSNQEKNSLYTQATQTLGVAIEHLIIQMGTLTKTVTVFGERLSHIEDKVLKMEKRVIKSQITSNKSK